jgi:hypothetical protein
MKTYISILFYIIIIILITVSVYANDGDTIKVRTVEFSSSKVGKYLFPPKSDRFQKILMNYKIKCPCAEWDYLAYVYADSTQIFRFITPYGNGMSLPNGFTWVIDVSDFEPLLHDSVKIDVSSNGQEPVELTFDFIKGTPPRDVVKIEQLWSITKEYDSVFNQNLPPRKVFTSAQEKMSRLKVIHTGHGFNNGTDCSEFCSKISYISVNNDTCHKKAIWTDRCRLNPLYPQGGTWVYSRSNWCPGSAVYFLDYELTEFMKQADSNTIKYEMEYFNTPTTGFKPRYDVTAYLVTYSNPNFKTDASIEEIISPSLKNEYLRRNPICSNPIISVKNSGSDTITNIKFKYGITNLIQNEFTWNGKLAFLESQEINLPQNDFGHLIADSTFKFLVQIVNVNGTDDEYSSNNYAESSFKATPEYDTSFIINLKTNLHASEQYSEVLANSSGDILLSRDNMSDNTLYQDTLNLKPGCYTYSLTNAIGYGLDWWAVRDQLGSGSLNFSDYSKTKILNPDFGGLIYQQFRADIKPRALSSIDTLYYDTVLVNQTKDLNFEVTPSNDKGITIQSINVNLGSKRGFTLISTNPDVTKGAVNLKQGEKLSGTIRFNPTKSGISSTNTFISTNDYHNQTLTIRLVGIGFDPNSDVTETYSHSNLTLNAYPNPFSNELNIEFSSGVKSSVNTKISLVNEYGSEVAIVFIGAAEPNIKAIQFNSSELSQGVYYLLMQSGYYTESLPLILIK